MFRNRIKTAFLTFCSLLLPCAVTISTPAAAEETSYSFGVVPQFEARKLNAIWQPILHNLHEQTGITVTLKGAPTIPRFEKGFMAGAYDFAYMNPWHSVVARDKQGYVPLVRDTGRSLFGILVVSKKSGITTLEDLSGKEIAFPSPNALGASLLMRAELAEQHGLDFTPKYVQTHSSVYLNAALGQTAAGGGVMGTLKRQAAGLQDQLVILHETSRVAPHPVVAHPRVPEKVQIALRKAFLALGKDDKGKALLEKVPVRQIGPATLDDYESLRKLGLEKYQSSPNS